MSTSLPPEINTTPTRPYMIRAIFEWIEDNNLTPYLMVDTTKKQVSVPMEYIQDGRIVLNIASRATGNLIIDNDFINFHARFGGVSREIWVPIAAVMGIYAKENSQGMFFDPAEYGDIDSDTAKSMDHQSSADSNKPQEATQENRLKRANTAGLKILD